MPRGFDMHCTAGHLRAFGLYWCLCEERFGREVAVARLEELAAVEVQALTGELAQTDHVRMHSVGVALL
jgi:tRNA 2-(methylsulfanyl)-N6-isopentenyladenosine37 hydroxylase